MFTFALKLGLKDVDQFISKEKVVDDKFYPELYDPLLKACKVVPDNFENHTMVRILGSIRTDVSNEVVVNSAGEFFSQCDYMCDSSGSLDDAVLFAMSRLVKANVEGDFREAVMRTTLHLAGVSVRPEIIYVYANVVVDHKLKYEPFFKLKEGYSFKSIESLDSGSDSKLHSDLLERLVRVRG